MHIMYEILRGIKRLERTIEEQFAYFHYTWGRHPVRSQFHIFIKNIKIDLTMGKLTVSTGAAVAGTVSPLDANKKKLPVSAFKTGSCKFSVADGSGFTVAAGSTEEDWAITETNPGTGSTGTLLFDSQDINGVQLPQSSLDIEFTDLAVASEIDVTSPAATV